MTKDNIKAILETAKDGDIVEFVTDNQHLFYDRELDSFPVLFDDDKQLIIVFKKNVDPYCQDKCPMTINYVEYDIIQQINIHHTSVHAYELFNSKYASMLDEEVAGEVKQKILKTMSLTPKVPAYYQLTNEVQETTTDDADAATE